MRRLRDQGKIRFTGVTEGFVQDPSHEMLRHGLRDELWDVVMVGFNLLHPSARRSVFPQTTQKRVGVLNMFAVRRALSQPDRLRSILQDLIGKGALADSLLNLEDPLDFVLRESDAASLPEVAYRFCRHEHGVDVVLTGTGNAEHLKANVEAILKPPLPRPVLKKLEELFGDIDYLPAN